jgi:hypothetical protein
MTTGVSTKGTGRMTILRVGDWWLCPVIVSKSVSASLASGMMGSLMGMRRVIMGRLRGKEFCRILLENIFAEWG